MDGDDGMPFTRVKLRHPVKTADGKTVKYLSRERSGQRAFVLADVHKYLEDNPQAPIILTEGEKKAWSATRKGLPAVGLIGNYGWKIGETKELLPELIRYLSQPRPVIVIWDSDASSNKSFFVATKQLATALRKYGCSLKELILPSILCDGKTGLDDYRQCHTTEDLKVLLETAKTVEPDGRSISSPVNGVCGGHPAETKEIADVVAQKWLTSDGAKLLAYYGSSWYEYHEGVYVRLPEDCVDA